MVAKLPRSAPTAAAWLATGFSRVLSHVSSEAGLQSYRQATFITDAIIAKGN